MIGEPQVTTGGEEAGKWSSTGRQEVTLYFTQRVPPGRFIGDLQGAGLCARLYEGSTGLTKFFTAGLLGTLNMLTCIVHL